MKSTQEIDLIDRLHKLEKSQARYRLAFLLAAAVAALLCVVGAGRRSEDAIQAKSFEIVNEDSKVLARFSSVGGKGDFRTYRADGKPLVSMGTSTDDSGRLEVFNANGFPAITLATATGTGSGILILNNNAGERQVQIGSTTTNQGGIWIYNADHKLIAVMSAGGGTSDGVAETYDAAGKRTGHLP